MKRGIAKQALCEKVAFDRREVLQDGRGNVQGEFAEQFERYAGYTFMRGGEAVIASRLEGRQPIIVRVRRDSDTSLITSDWRIRDLGKGEWIGTGNDAYWSGVILAIRSIIETTDHRFLDIMAESGVAA